MATPSLVVAWGSCFLCALLAGCNDGRPKRVTVSGQALIDGAPLAFGSVRFIPVGGGRPSVADLGPDGRFDFGKEGVVAGKQRIEIIASEQVGPAGYRWHAPEKYASYATSGLEQDISQPTNDLVLTLSWEGRKPFTVQGPAVESDPKNLRSRK